jgi:hypothetical protein
MNITRRYATDALFVKKIELMEEAPRLTGPPTSSALRKRTPPHGIIAAGFKALHP